MDFLKSVGGKIATGAISLAVVAAGLAWYETDPETKHQILSVSGRLLGWAMLVLIVPWALFWLIAWVARRDSNPAGAALVLSITAVQAIVLAWMFGWSIHGATTWVLYVAAILIAGVYNVLSCDWIAEKSC
jgi:uncharacterized membrane protein YbhN (UPF0104 family)